MKVGKMIAPLLLLFCMASCHKEPTACFEPESESIDNNYSVKVMEKVEFNNCSKDATSYNWNFGDGKTSTAMNPTHKYETGGTYTVVLEACGDGGDQRKENKIDVASLDGDWEGMFKIGATVFVFYLNLKQNETDLTGKFELDDGSGEATLVASEVEKEAVSLKFKIKYNDTTTYTFLLNGETDDTYNRMEGDFLINDEEFGIWSANKFPSKGKTISKPVNCCSLFQQHIGSIKNFNNNKK
jgi:PKD repeat protein